MPEKPAPNSQVFNALTPKHYVIDGDRIIAAKHTSAPPPYEGDYSSFLFK